TVAMIVIGIVLVLATHEVLISKSHQLDASGFLLLFGCLIGMRASLRRVSKVNTTLQRSNAAAARIFEILDQPIERRRLRQSAPTHPPRTKIPPIQREIIFEHLTFAYPNAQHPAVEDV